MNNSTYKTAFFATLLLTATWGAQAANVSYIMDRSNVLPDNVQYLTVTLSDDVAGQLEFWVDVGSSLSTIATDNFGIQSFSFNLVRDLQPGLTEHGDGPCCKLDNILTTDSFILPGGWNVLLGDGGKGEGFDVRLLGSEGSRQDPLHFSILGLGLDDVQGEFGALVAGFKFRVGECGDGEGDHRNCDVIYRAEFQGGTPLVVPLPAAVWLLGCGLLGLAGVTRRRRVNSI